MRVWYPWAAVEALVESDTGRIFDATVYGADDVFDLWRDLRVRSLLRMRACAGVVYVRPTEEFWERVGIVLPTSDESGMPCLQPEI